MCVKIGRHIHLIMTDYYSKFSPNSWKMDYRGLLYEFSTHGLISWLIAYWWIIFPWGFSLFEWFTSYTSKRSSKLGLCIVIQKLLLKQIPVLRLTLLYLTGKECIPCEYLRFYVSQFSSLPYLLYVTLLSAIPSSSTPNFQEINVKC